MKIGNKVMYKNTEVVINRLMVDEQNALVLGFMYNDTQTYEYASNLEEVE